MEIKDIKAFRAAQGCVSTDETRGGGIQGIRIELGGKIVATDGVIFYMSAEAIDTKGLEAPVTIKPAKLLKANTKTAVIDIEAGLIKTDKEDIRFEVLDEAYPDYNQIIPGDDYSGELPAIGVGTTPVIKLFKALESLKESPRGSKSVKLAFGKTPGSVIKITFDDRPGDLALLMPVRL